MFHLEFFWDSGYNGKKTVRSLRIMSPEIAHTSNRPKTFLLAAAMAVTIGWVAYSGTRSIDQLLEKRRQIREMQEQNTILQRENERRKERIGRLNGNSSEQDMELRKLNLAKPGETMFMLPDDQKAPEKTGTTSTATPAGH